MRLGLEDVRFPLTEDLWEPQATDFIDLSLRFIHQVRNIDRNFKASIVISSLFYNISII